MTSWKTAGLLNGLPWSVPARVVGLPRAAQRELDPGLGEGAGLGGEGGTGGGPALGHGQLTELVGGEGEQDHDHEDGQQDDALAGTGTRFRTAVDHGGSGRRGCRRIGGRAIGRESWRRVGERPIGTRDKNPMDIGLHRRRFAAAGRGRRLERRSLFQWPAAGPGE